MQNAKSKKALPLPFLLPSSHKSLEIMWNAGTRTRNQELATSDQPQSAINKAINY
jgi:hypothetical protein